MPEPRACPITLTAADRRRLKERAAGRKTPFRDRQRALIVLLAARGHATAVVAARVGVNVDTARKWRTRFASQGIAGLTDLPRSGRPRRFTEIQRVEIKALACELPAAQGVPMSRWSCLDLALEVVTGGIVDAISPSTVRRILADDAIKPWQHRSWTPGCGPGSRSMGTNTSSPPTRRPPSRPVAAAIRPCPRHVGRTRLPPRRCAGLPDRLRRAPRQSHRPLRTHHRHHAVPGPRRTGDDPGAPRLGETGVLDVDNGSSHRGDTAIERLAEAFPTAVMVHTSIHASWINQVEIYYSIVQRKALTPNDFTDLAEVENRLAAFEQRFNATATPFDWTLTADNLDDLLARIDRHAGADQPEPLTTREAA